MKKEQGFSLIELLIVVAIIAIIAAIAVPSLMTARRASNEASAVQGCRTIGSAEIAYAATANQKYDTIGNLVTAGMLDGRFSAGQLIDGYGYAEGTVTTADPGSTAVTFTTTAGGGPDFGINATPDGTMGRFVYGIGTDQVVRFIGNATGYSGTPPMSAGQAVGTGAAASGGSGSGS